MDRVMILATPQEIAEGLKKFLADIKQEPQNKDFKEEKMTIGEAAPFIDVSYPTLCKWISAGKFRVHGKGRKRFVLKSELIEDYKSLK